MGRVNLLLYILFWGTRFYALASNFSRSSFLACEQWTPFPTYKIQTDYVHETTCGTTLSSPVGTKAAISRQIWGARSSRSVHPNPRVGTQLFSNSAKSLDILSLHHKKTADILGLQDYKKYWLWEQGTKMPGGRGGAGVQPSNRVPSSPSH